MEHKPNTGHTIRLSEINTLVNYFDFYVCGIRRIRSQLHHSNIKNLSINVVIDGKESPTTDELH